MPISYRSIPLAVTLFLANAPAFASVDKPESITVPSPTAGKAEIVFFRANGFVGSAISCAVREGNTKISSLPPGRFFIMVADPGKHTYSSTSSSDNGINLTLNEGEIRYVRCTILPGFWAGKGSLDVAKDEDFTTKLWKSVDPTRISANVLTDEQIRADNAAQQANAAPISSTVPSTADTPVGTVLAATAPAAPPATSAALVPHP